MTYVAALLALPAYQAHLKNLEEKEQTRIYCRHNLSHFLDVARITMLLSQEHDLHLNQEEVYLAALLHDLGRGVEGNMPHGAAGIPIAKALLTAIDFPAERQADILDVIGNHRFQGKNAPGNFIEAFSLADTLSRPCYHCPARSTCHWPDTRKNRFPLY